MKEYLVVHTGWAVPSFVWSPLLKRLEEDYQIIFIEWQGTSCLKDFKERIYESVKEIESYSLMGWSLGSLVALELLAEKGSSINKVILISGTSKFTQSDSYPIGWHVKILQQMIRRYKVYPRETLESFYRNLFSERERAEGYEQNFFYALEIEDSDSLEVGLQYLIESDMRDRLSKIEQDVLLIHGTLDQICPIESSYFLHQQIKGLKLVQLDGTGHIPFYVEPEKCYQEIKIFLLGG